MAHPDHDDVVIRQQHGTASAVYVLSTPSAPDPLIVHTRDNAVSHALAFAKRQHVRVWVADTDDDAVVLRTFRREQVNPSKTNEVS